MKNTAWSVVQHLVAIVCGLILPREILARYGSEMNGVMHSISQFLTYTVVLEMGIGAVIPAALYPALAEGNRRKVSGILMSGYSVFRKIALVCAVYTVILAFVFSGVSEASFVLVLILGAGTVCHYLAGTPEQLLIISDQKGYIVYALSALGSVISTASQVFLIRSGHSLEAVKAAGLLLGIAHIILICFYTRRHYAIDRSVKEPIPQKWEGAAQHIAYIVLENTDIILLTLFAGFGEVSVYSVYFMVISGVRRIFSSVTYSVQPKLGELRAKGDQAELNRFFASFERWIHISTVLAFGLVGLLLVPFVQVYTEGVRDADYIRPLFALLLTLAYACQSLRDPYDKLILASGHFRQTRGNYIIAAGLNLGISLAGVLLWGLEGVAAGTLIAMAYQLVYMEHYDTGILLKRSRRELCKTLAIDAGLVVLILLVSNLVSFPAAELFRRVLRLMP